MSQHKSIIVNKYCQEEEEKRQTHSGSLVPWFFSQSTSQSGGLGAPSSSSSMRAVLREVIAPVASGVGGCKNPIVDAGLADLEFFFLCDTIFKNHAGNFTS